MNLLRHLLISVCCGEPGRPCGALIGPRPLRSVPAHSAGLSHGLCPAHVAKMRSELKVLDRRRAERVEV